MSEVPPKKKARCRQKTVNGEITLVQYPGRLCGEIDYSPTRCPFDGKSIAIKMVKDI